MKFDDELEDERSFLQRYGFVLGVGAVVVLAVVVFAGRQLFSSHKEAPRKNQEISMVKLLPPPPPPPPPLQKPPEPMKQEMVAQEHVDKDEQKPDEQPKAEPVSTGLKGNGPDSFGLSSSGGGGALGGNGHHGSKFGWYAAQVITQVEDALRANPKIRAAKLRIIVRIWPDPITDRVTRVELSGSTGDPALENAIKNEVMTGLQLREAPPKDMPLPIVMRITAQRPS